MLFLLKLVQDLSSIRLGKNIVTEATQGLFGKAGDLNLLKGSMLADPSGKNKINQCSGNRNRYNIFGAKC